MSTKPYPPDVEGFEDEEWSPETEVAFPSKSHQFQVEGGGSRLDKFLASKLSELTRSRIQSLIKEGCLTLDGSVEKKASKVLTSGQIIQLNIPESKEVEIKAQAIPLKVLYEDEDLLVVDKESGMVVHPAPGNPDGTLVNALLAHCVGSLSGIGGETRPGIVHRLDKETSGCLVVAKHDRAHVRLVEMFSNRELTKEYLAVVNGIPGLAGGRIENLIGRHPQDRKRMAVLSQGGKLAVSEWKRVPGTLVSGASLVHFHLLTGRTHQIRVHCKEVLKTAILGDEIYGKSSKDPVRTGRLMLHAWRLAFKHPLTGRELSFVATLPGEFQDWRPQEGWETITRFPE